MYVCRCGNVFFMIGADGIHYRAGGGYPDRSGLLQIFKKVDLQLIFVLPVGLKLGREMVVVGGCKGIDRVVNQFSHSIKIPKAELAAFFQTPGKPGHISAGIAPVMTPQPFAAHRALEIGGWIQIRLGAAQQKCKGVPSGRYLQVILDKI